MKLRPTSWTLNRCRELYNAALSERRDAYRYAGISIKYYDQQNDLPEIRHDIREEYADIASHVLQDVLRRLDKAIQAFFRRVLYGETSGYPRFQGRDRYDSFTYPDNGGNQHPCERTTNTGWDAADTVTRVEAPMFNVGVRHVGIERACKNA